MSTGGTWRTGGVMPSKPSLRSARQTRSEWGGGASGSDPRCSMRLAACGASRKLS
jgi:hypothetical protein